MADIAASSVRGLSKRGGQPLIGVPLGDHPDDAVQYFTSEEEADQALASDPENQRLALGAIGAWAEMDFDEMLDELDCIRHTHRPSLSKPRRRA